MSRDESIEIRTSTQIQTAIGRRMYPDPQVAIVELTSNSYDADADNVHILVSSNKIAVMDDGWGMSEQALHSFFTLGKSTKPPSSKDREPIGNFGIGKFAILSMADEFSVFTKTQDFYAKATYSHSEALGAGDYLSDYRVPTIIFETEKEYRAALTAAVGTDKYYDPSKTGVAIVIADLHRTYADSIIKQRLVEMLVPQAKDSFNVYVNGELLEERYVHGLRYDVNLSTEYGDITGEVIVAAESVDLADQMGVQIRVQGRGLYRTHFGLIGYDPVARRLSGYVVADWLNDVIASNRTELIASPEKTAFETAVITALRSILDQEASKRAAENEEKKKQVLDKAVRTVTRVLNKLPEFDFPKRALTSMIPIGALDDVAAGKDPVADIEDDGLVEAEITAAQGNRAFSQLLDFLREIAPQFNVEESDVPTGIETITDALDVIQTILGQPLEEFIGRETLEELMGAVPRDEMVKRPEIYEGALHLASRRLEDILRRITTPETVPTAHAKLVEGVSPKTPITNALDLTKVNLSPIAPPDDLSTLDLRVNPFEEGYAPDSPQAQINTFIAASVEHLGETGPASMVAEGFGFDGIQIYINADHQVYKTVEEDSPTMLAFYQAQLIFSEVVLLQNFTPREAIDKQAELMRLLIQTDRKILNFKG